MALAALLFKFAALILLILGLQRLSQYLFGRKDEPPVVHYWLPFVGSAITYGQNPYAFFFRCREKYGNVFSFVLLGKKMTVCLGTQGNDFILHGRLQDVNAEEIYVNLTTPVFGSGVVYGCSNAVLMEQKKFHEIRLRRAEHTIAKLLCQGFEGSISVTRVMAELTIYMASRTLQGKEVRQKFNSNFAGLYHDLDMGFTPINFMMPWLPLPVNRRRDLAQRTLARTYIQIIEARRKLGKGLVMENDMIWHSMSSRYKNGNPTPDQEIAHMMIALLMAGQHSSSSIASWIMLRLASRPDITEELYQEQIRVLDRCEKGMMGPLTYEEISLLTLNPLG